MKRGGLVRCMRGALDQPFACTLLGWRPESRPFLRFTENNEAKRREQVHLAVAASAAFLLRDARHDVQYEPRAGEWPA